MIKNMQSRYDEFERNQKKLRIEYISCGMSEENIQKLYEFDKKQFNRDIAYDRRNITIDTTTEEQPSLEVSPLLKDFESKMTTQLDTNSFSRYFWIEEISDKGLAQKLKRLKSSDLELITLIVKDGYTQADIARFQGIKESTISNKIKRIKKIF